MDRSYDRRRTAERRMEPSGREGVRSGSTQFGARILPKAAKVRNLDIALLASRLRLFHLKQLPFAIDSPAIAAHFSVFSHHPMTRDLDGNAIASTGSRHGSHGCWLAYGLGNVRVRTRHSEWNRLQVRPHFSLKCGRLNVERKH